jgi:hypothetical protein
VFVLGTKPIGKLTTQEILKAKTDVFTPTPTENLPYKSEETLFQSIRAFIVKHVELPADIYYDISASFVLATWRVEQARSATYLNPLAAHGSGKSTYDEILQILCFKSVNSEGATRGAIIRIADGTNATLILDESDNWLNPRDYDNPVAAVLNAGYRRRLIGGGVLLCEPKRNGEYAAVQRDSFGFKVISGRNPLNDVLASRAITIRMRKTNRTFPKPDYAEAWMLRKQLLKYQENHADEPLEHPATERIGDGRLREIFEPLLAAAPNDEIRNHLIDFANEELERRRKEELMSVEAIVARVTVELADKDPTRSRILVKEITDTVNADIPNPKEHVDSRYVGKLLKRLGLQGDHDREGNVILVDRAQFDYLRERYMPSTEKPKTLENILEAR